MINQKQFTKVGIVGFGGYVPKYRIKVEEIAKVYGKDGKKIAMSLGVKQKAVADKDEDAVSLAVEAGQIALDRAGIKAKELGAILVGSESHAYAVKPTGTIVADILGTGSDYFCADLEFACKAGTTGVIMIASMIEAGLIDCGLAIGADVAQSQPGDVLEYTAGAGAGAIILGSRKYKWFSSLERVSSYNSDTADFWRREGEKYPSHAGRFTGEPGYFKHVISGTEKFLEKSKEKISSFDQVILHMPNVKFVKRAAKRLGVREKQLKEGLIVEKIGNPYSGSSVLGLIKVLESAGKNEKVFLTSYGSGAGSDSLSFKVEKELQKSGEKKDVDLESQFNNIEYISYTEYLKKQGRL
ncbi:MAG: hydroxymethylglutaryl-CoA synthase [Patescibacteria group bacterium]|nr:hydroxymethylglutaryl-CoA synthase [Patescibacteria group bacterium]